jgi:hypothetical protein
VKDQCAAALWRKLTPKVGMKILLVPRLLYLSRGTT